MSEGFEGMPVEGMEEAPFLNDFDPAEACAPEEDTETQAVEIDLLAKAQEFGELNEKKRLLKKELEDVEARMKAINDQICEKMIFENPNIKVRVGTKKDGKPLFKTVYVKSTIWAGYAEDKMALMEAMKACGLDDMVSETFNTQTLSGYVRGFDPDRKLSLEELKALLPEALQAHIKLSQTDAIAVKS